MGANFDEPKSQRSLCRERGSTYVHPFDDPYTIAGQGTIAKEIYDHATFRPDVILASIGGGGMVAGISIYSKGVSPDTRIIGVESRGTGSDEPKFKGG
ncbi:MAG: pyridoxal-phosphate dependent enzyme [Deinococcales bacterium]